MISVAAEVEFVVQDQPREDLERACQVIMEELLTIENEDGGSTHSASVAVDLDRSAVTIALCALAESFEAADQRIEEAMVRAIRKAGGRVGPAAIQGVFEVSRTRRDAELLCA
ncbi:MAG: hypothetical protein U0Q15_18625 [Kineosporiaceae bacterium]